MLVCYLIFAHNALANVFTLQNVLQICAEEREEDEEEDIYESLQGDDDDPVDPDAPPPLEDAVMSQAEMDFEEKHNTRFRKQTERLIEQAGAAKSTEQPVLRRLQGDVFHAMLRARVMARHSAKQAYSRSLQSAFYVPYKR